MLNLAFRIGLISAVASAFLVCDASAETGEVKRSPAAVSGEIVRIPIKEIPPADAIAKVGDRYVTVADYKKQLTRLPSSLAESEQGRNFVMKQIIDNLLVEKEAEARGLTEDPALVARIEDFARNLYKNALTGSFQGNQTSITDEEAKEYFLEREDEFVQPERARFSLIQLPPDQEKEINALHRELRAGEDFAELAKTHSKHVSASRGGELGLLSRGQFKELTDVAFNTKPGDISKPFKFPAGWAVIKVHEIITKEKIPLEEGIMRAKARLEAVEASKRFDALMTDLRAKHRVTLYEDRIKGLQP